METRPCWCVWLKFIHSSLLCSILLCEHLLCDDLFFLLSRDMSEGHLFVITNCPTRNSLEVVSLYTFGRLSLGSSSQSGVFKPAAPGNLLEMQIICLPRDHWITAHVNGSEWRNECVDKQRHCNLSPQRSPKPAARKIHEQKIAKTNNVKWCSHFGSLAAAQKLNIKLPYVPAILLLSIYS